MNVVNILLSTAAAFILLFLIFRPLEAVFPAKEGQPALREHWFVDLAFFLGQYLVWNAAVLTLISFFGHNVRDFVPIEFRSFVARQPIAVQTIFVILMSDFIV